MVGGRGGLPRYRLVSYSRRSGGLERRGVLRSSLIGRAVTLAGVDRARILGDMAKGWIIIAHRKQEGTGAPLEEWYAVTIPDRVRAVETLRLRKNLLDATLTIDSEASPEYLDQLDVKDGQILSIVPL